MKKRSVAAKTVMMVLLIMYLVFLAFPLVWLVSTSFKTPSEIFSEHSTIIPRRPTTENYRSAVVDRGVLKGALNTLKVSAFSAILTLIVATPTSYFLARRQSGLNKAVLGWILASQTFPSILIIVPLFLLLSRVGLADTHAGLIVVYVVWSLPFVLWMLQGYVKGLPVELEEAAAVDGATQSQIIRKIIGPLILPGLVATGLYAFITSWSEFFFALVMLKNPELATIQVILARYRGTEGVALWGPLAAGSIIATIPSLVLFSFMQKGLVSGLLSGSVKS